MSAPEIHTWDSAPWFITLHLLVAGLALVVGALILARRKGDLTHRYLGRTWVVLMLVTASGSFLIQARGRLSLIHLLSVLVLVSVPMGILQIRRGRVRGHMLTMTFTYLGLVIAGAFTLLPYRMLGQLVLGAR